RLLRRKSQTRWGSILSSFQSWSLLAMTTDCYMNLRRRSIDPQNAETREYPCWSNSTLCGVHHRLLVSLHVLVVPTQVSFISVLHVARACDAVKFVWIDHELSLDAQAAQRLVHLLATLNGHVEVALAAEKQRRRLDTVGVQERVRDFDVGLPGLRIPRWANFIVVLNDVLIGAIEGDGER